MYITRGVRDLYTTILLCLTAMVSAQNVFPSNSTQDLYPEATSPRFFVNATGVSLHIAPLGPYAQISYSNFRSILMSGRLIGVDASNANAVKSDSFSYISCDPQAYDGVLDADHVFQIVINAQQANSVILYSTTSNHCTATGLKDVRVVNGIFTTTDSLEAARAADRLADEPDGIGATISPDPNAYTNSSGSGNGWGGSTYGASSPSPTTAVAMIILYTITGIITALFVIIIITGAVRAHRHPERYGPRNIVGRPRQSRAKGIARAMLETLPIVKFGDHDDVAKKPTEGDIEITAANKTEAPPEDANKSVAVASAIAGITEASEPDRMNSTASGGRADGTDEEGNLGCSICTEDFNKGEEVRVLPCNHKFHPECVDPWLLNVSGTCPLCRIDLRPQGEQPAEGSTSRRGSSAAATNEGPDATFAPSLGPLPIRLDRAAGGSGSGETVTSLRQMAGGSREERIAALRRFRQQRRNRGVEEGPSEEDRGGLARRFREGFRIRTRRQGEVETQPPVAEGSDQT